MCDTSFISQKQFCLEQLRVKCNLAGGGVLGKGGVARGDNAEARDPQSLCDRQLQQTTRIRKGVCKCVKHAHPNYAQREICQIVFVMRIVGKQSLHHT